MKIKFKFLFSIWAIILVLSAVFTLYSYSLTQSNLLKGIDQKLYTSATMLGYVLPTDYHDNLNNNSFSQQEYLMKIVDKNDKICKDLDLQYVWSNMLIDGKIVFTTSSSENISKKNSAEFFSVHSDPSAFTEVFSTMNVTYSSFKNEWGNGRMILIPHLDKNGRKYVFGASIATNEVSQILLKNLINNLLFFIFALVLGFIISMIISSSMTERIYKLADFAIKFKKGEKTLRVNISNGDEIGALAHILNEMAESIQKKESDLERQAETLDKRVKKRTEELEKFNKVAVDRELKMIELKKKIAKFEEEKK